MSNNYEQQVEDIILAKWDSGEYDEEFVMWCFEHGIHKDDAPDFEDRFMQEKFDLLLMEFE